MKRDCEIGCQSDIHCRRDIRYYNDNDDDYIWDDLHI